MKTAAVLDIGSNTILLTVGKRCPNGEIEIILDRGEIARLSEGLQDGGPLQAAARARALQTLRQFKNIAEEKEATQMVAAGTAAFRRASDGKQFAEEIQKQLKIPVKILSGEEEARYSYQSAQLDFSKKYGPIGMIDVGGGSTEFVFGEKGPNDSLPLGTVRMTEDFISAHPISDSEWDILQKEIQNILRDNLKKMPHSPTTWVAVAATPASLAAVYLRLPHYQPERVHGLKLNGKELGELVERLRKASMPERLAMPGMDPKRAELLPVGGLILWKSMEFLGLREIIVSDHGLRYGLLAEILKSASKNSYFRGPL